MRKLIFAIATGVAVLIVGAASAQPVLQIVWSQQCDGEVRVRGTTVECWQESQPPTPSETPTAEPGVTATPTITPTATVTPTVTPTPDPSVPLCTHDPLLWHDLYDEVEGCRYTHEHGDDPNRANAVFGLPGEWFGQPGYEIGSPSFPAHEMADGHPFLKWYVHTEIPASMNDYKPAGGSYIKATRIQVHAATGGAGIRHRYHGFELEVQVCQPAPADSRTNETCGIARYSGVLDYGNLRIVSNDPTGSTVVLLPGEPDGQGVELRQGKRIHVGNDAPAIPAVSALWYSGTWCAQVEDYQVGCTSNAVMIHDSWSYITPTPEGVNIDWVCGDYLTCGRNGSLRELHVVASEVNAQALNATWAGNADGTPNPSCVLGQPGCGMFVSENVPESGYMLYATHGAPWLVRDYDTSPPEQHWIEYPN